MEKTIGLTLETLAKVISEMTGEKAEIREVWLDYSANIWGKNILVGEDEDRSYQLLNFRERAKLKNGEYGLIDIQKNIDTIKDHNIRYG